MPHFILIDHLLEDVGGHNFQYSMDVSQAAEAAGYQPVLATRREFAARDHLPKNWLVRPLFRYGWSQRHLAGVDGKSEQPIGPDGRHLPPLPRKSSASELLQDLLDRRRRVDRQRRIEDFAQACSTLFDEFGFAANSCVFLPTVSEFDLIGLVRFLDQTPESVKLDWHLQFHFDIFHGREADYASQESRCTLIRRQFTAALSQVPRHRLHFYATTPHVARQYNLLKIGNFGPLPYPVADQILLPATPTESPQKPTSPLRITCAGTMRREKGKRMLRPVVDSLADSLSARQIQIWLQTSPRAARRFLGRKWTGNLQFHDHVPATSGDPIVALRYPLGRNDYVKLIQQSDIGLFLYDSKRYHARCSGVLVEMLAAGKPVVVPAGCWLADQIQEPIYQHLDKLCEQTLDNDGLPLEQISSAGIQHEATFESPVVPGTRALVCSFSLGAAQATGHYLQLAVQPFQGTRHTGKKQTMILGQRANGRTMRALFRVDPFTDSVQLKFRFAYEAAPMELNELAVHRLPNEIDCHAGQVGLISASMNEVPRLVNELTQNYDHYCSTAQSYARRWGYEHNANRTLEILQDNQRRSVSLQNAG
ncbi:MAG: hypothetical protein QGG71_10075 [Pirellulaceae bacterium]|jgi:hypothetical protein|nr:hypothetical protein [Pirellulaceae bacterium]